MDTLTVLPKAGKKNESRFALLRALVTMQVAQVLAMVAALEVKVGNALVKSGAFRRDSAAFHAVVGIAVSFLVLIIVVVIVLQMFPTLTGAINTAQDDPNLSDGGSSVIGALPLILAAALVIIVLVVAFYSIGKKRGMF